MAADSDGTLTAVVICEGNLHDPEFPKKFRILLGKLKTILQQPKSKKLKVNKVEPWNSVRVTLSIPKDAAARLRQLAAEGSSALRALGILSVQLEGDTVISLRLVGQEIVLRTDNNPAGCAQEAGPSSGLGGLSRILANPMQTATTSCTTLPSNTPAIVSEPIAGPSRIVPQSPSTGSSSPAVVNGPNFDKPPIFKSPNTICPMDGKLPVPPIANIAETREYPFESMTQARVIQRRENTMAVAAALGQGQSPLSTQTTSVPSNPQQVVVAGTNQSLVIGQSPQPPPPLVIPAKPLVVSPQQSLPQEPSLKSQFVQPPPPPYPNVATNSAKASLAVQHQANTITLPINPSLNSNSNNIAISSPLLVNLLQNDGVNQVKQHQQTVSVAQKPSPVVIQQQQQQIQPQLQAIVSNIKSPQQTDILLNQGGVSHHSQNESVLMQGGQIIVNNSGVVNPSNVSTNISLNPSMPVPSSLTISNISTINTNQGSPHNTTPSPVAIGPQPQTLVNQNIVSNINVPPNINIRMQQLQQQQRFNSQAQQQLLLRQQQIMPPVGNPLQRFPQQNQAQQPTIINTVSQQQPFRHPVQQASPQPPPPQPQQQYVTPPPSPHPNAIAANHTNIAMQTTTSLQQQQSQQQQQMQGTTYNHPRWPFKPMDSATKSSFQEFTRYQMQYNLQQQMNQSALSANSTSSSNNDKQNLDPLGLVGLSDLDELTKNDLDSLLPSLNVSDLDSALGLDGKNALESLLDAKDLDLDLIDQDIPNLTGTSLLESAFDHPSQETNSNNEENNVFPGLEPSLTSTGKQRQYLINPLTGELEPMPSEESDTEPEPENIDAFNEFNSEVSNSLYSDDENSCSTAFSKASDHSDTERSSNSETSVRSRYSKNRKERKDVGGGGTGNSKKAKLGLKGNLLREKIQQGIKDKISGKTKQYREKTSKAKLIATTTESKDSPAEKIKLRLKLEKSEPVTPAYKVDISFVQSPKRAQTAVCTSTSVSLTSISSTTLSATANSSPNPAQQQTNAVQNTSHQQQSLAGEEPRVPPLHISLRGKNSIVIKNSKKDRKKSQSGGEEDDGYFKKNQIKRNHSNFDDQVGVRNLSSTDDSAGGKNNLYPNLMTKILSQGKPASRQSNEEYVVSNTHSKFPQPPSSGNILENGEDFDGNGVSKTNQSSKRNASELIHSPNGLICPETKRRRMSQTAFEQMTQQTQDSIPEPDAYSHLKGPIGSTNVGTLPQHSNLTKNQKCTNNNNSPNYNSKGTKNIVKSGKPLVVVKNCKSPTSNTVKDPGKSPPILVNSPTPSSVHTTVNSNIVSQTDAATESSSNNVNKTVCLLPQTSSDTISEEKFKQKLLEVRNSEKVEDANTSIANSGSVQIVEQKSPHFHSKTQSREVGTFTTPSESVVTSANIPSSKSTNSIEDLKEKKVDKREDSENSVNHGVRPPENTIKQTHPSHNQEAPSNVSSNTTKIASNDVGSQSTINSLTNNGNNIVRNSPGSQAQGEDSGIESMDALSEKSPHQSSSPQQSDGQKQLTTVHKIVSEEKPSTVDSKEDIVDEITSIGDIEAALAKMEGINEHFLTPCESPTPKFNGDLVMKEECLLENLTDEKIIFCAPKIEHEDLSEIMLGSDEKIKMECRDLNENKEISLKSSLEAQLVDECCKNNGKVNINFGNDNNTPGSRTIEANIEKSVLESVEKFKIKTEEITKEIGKNEPSEIIPDECNIKGNNLSSNKEVMAPITIDIPTQAETDAHRVRTRASSKLESPMDLPKQSPQLDSPASSIKSNLRLSSMAGDRLSPKINTGKCIGGGGKRKRHGSESSTQSCVSDDTPGKGVGGGSGATSGNNSKRSRQSNLNGGNGESVNNNNSVKTSSNSSKRGSSTEGCTSGKSNQSKSKKNDESSDSDEPLIEVVGKVRNSKNTTKTSSSDAEKVLRNHRVSQLKSTSNVTIVSANNASSNTSKTIRGTSSTSLPSSSALVAGSSSSHNNQNSTSGNNTTTINSHSTRGSNIVTNPSDDKIGTRRSVRASAAANKIIYSKNLITETPKTAANKLNTLSAGDVTDARRKTRSAAGTETSAEGRRRRGSRDSK